MKLIFVNSNDQQREVYRIYLENIISDTTILEADCLELAKKKLSDINDYDMVLCCDNLPQAGAWQLYQYVRQLSSTIHFALFSSTHPNQLQHFEGFLSTTSKNHHIKFPIVPGEFRQAILEILKPSYLNNMRVAAFQKVRVLHFYRFNKVLCNVYIRLSEHKYIKIINAGEIYSKEQLNRYEAKGTSHFYIANSDYEKFEASFLRPSFLVMDHQHASSEELAQTLISTHAILQDIAHSLGFNKQSVDLADAAIANLRQLIEKEGSLIDIFNKISRDQDYIYHHSYLTAIAAVELLQLVKKDNESRINNLCMASLMHDITLTSPEIAKIERLDDPRLNDFSKEEVKQFIKHPLEIADLLLESPFANSEVVEIVRQHHENIEGTGFPCKLAPNKIDIATAVFLIAHDYIHRMFEVDFDSTKNEEIRQELKTKYNVANFAKISSSFADQLKKAG